MKIIKTIILILFLISCHYQTSAQVQSVKKLHHVLLFDWIEDIDINAKKEVQDSLKKLPSKIEGLEKISIHELSMSTEEFETIVIMVFNTDKALEEYQKHPEHLEIKKKAKPLIVGMSKFDYWK